MNIGEKHLIKIDKLTFGGDGLGRINGIVVFVPFTAPGDLALIEITEAKKNFYRGSLLELKESSPLRTTPRCEYFLKCGGCQWQHISYENQVATKESLVLENIKGYFKQNTLWEKIVPSPREWSYRNRIQLKIVDKSIGYFANGSHRLIEVKHCEIAEEPLSKAIPHVEIPPKKSRDIERVELSLDQDLNIQLNWNYSVNNPSAFSQVNRWQNEKLIETVLRWLDDLDFDKIFDLYAGQGNFTFPLAFKYKKETIGVEYNAKAVTLANQRIAKDSLKGIRFYSGDVAAVLRVLSKQEKSIILLDPPRAGCESVALEQIKSIKPAHICYISCDPTTLKRDLAILTKDDHYQVTKATAFDMFPQTHHVETMVLLKRQS